MLEYKLIEESKIQSFNETLNSHINDGWHKEGQHFIYYDGFGSNYTQMLTREKSKAA